MKDSLIEKFVLKFPNDTSFDALKAAVAEERWDDAFAAVHTLKGVSLNLAFERLGASASELTEVLRPQNSAGRDLTTILGLFETVQEDYETVIAQLAIYSA